MATRVAAEPVLGVRYLSRANEIERWWQRSSDERDAWRADALKAVLDYAGRHVPAYRALNPGEPGLDLTALPVIDKQVIFDNEEQFLSDEHESIPAVEKHTGGSTGDPWNYPLDRRAWAESYAIQIFRFRKLGFGYGDRRVTLGFPTSLGLQGMGASKRLRLRAERTDVSLCGFEVDPATSRARALAACRMDAQLWYGYASTIAAMAAAVLDDAQLRDRLRHRGPPLIITMAEPLWPAWRDDIVAAFGSTVVEEYGCNDGGIMSHRCAAGNFHLADHQSIVEVLDDEGRPTPPGVDGDVVVTNFHARHMPFIRYKVGDRVAWGPDRCSCGEPGRTLDRVAGRTGDFVRLPNGTELSPTTFFNPFNEVAGVRRWQIVQPDLRHLVVRIEARPSWSASDEHVIRSWIEERTERLLDVRITTEEPLDLTSGGKHKVLVRSFD